MKFKLKVRIKTNPAEIMRLAQTQVSPVCSYQVMCSVKKRVRFSKLYTNYVTAKNS